MQHEAKVSITKETRQDQIRVFRHAALPDADLLTAAIVSHRFEPHWHDFYAIPVVQAGAKGFYYRKAFFVATPGRMIIINPGEMHTGQVVDEEGWVYRAFYPPIHWLQCLSDELAGRPTAMPWFPHAALDDADLSGLLLQAHCLLEQGRDPLQAESLLVSGLSQLLLRHAGTRPTLAPTYRDDARVQQMLLRLADDPAQDLSLQMLADQVGLSRYHAVRLFSQTVGMPPHAWRVQLRVNRAVAAMRKGVSVTQAALDAGFSDQSHFTRHFKRAFGVAPGRWQQARRAA